MGKFRIIIKAIVEYENRFLAVERWYNDCIVEPYQWEFLDAEMEYGETPESAAQRLVSDAVGLDADVVDTLYTWGFTAGEICTTGITFLCKASQDAIFLSDDLSDYKWVPKEELPQVITKQAVIRDMIKAGFISDTDVEN